MNQATIETSGERRQAGELSLSPSGKTDDMLFFNSLFFIDVVNQYPAWYTSVSCNSAQNSCTEWHHCVTLLCRHFFHVTSSLFCLFLIIWSQTMQSLFCPNNADNWENMVCACRNVNHSLLSVAPCLNQLCLGAQGQLWNSVVLVCCCVFCLGRRAVIKFTSCWVRCCQAHTYSTLVSHLSAPYPLCSFLSFFSPVGWEAGRMKAKRLSIKAKLCRNDSFSRFWLNMHIRD